MPKFYRHGSEGGGRSGSMSLKKPREHQKEALAAIRKGLKTHRRGKVLMATGTGKALLALWAAREHAEDSILVLVPSLALARQIYEEWRDVNVKDNVRNSDWLVVCSDTSVIRGKDEDETTEEQEATRKAIEAQGGTVVNDSKSINLFLRQSRRKPAIVISTYQSATLLAEGLPRGFKFDVGVFDEAHKTAGAAGKLFSFALLDKNVPIHQRLFFTATPRHSTYSAKKGEEKLIFHMGDEKIYGPTFHELSFKEAVERKLIVDYDVILAVIQRPGLSRDDILADADQALLAKTLMVMKTADKYGVQKIFSFHETNKRALQAQELYSHHGRGFKTLRVDGTQDVAERANTLEKFKDAKKAIVANSRCLGEGVNVPMCDAVAFLAPRRSRIDVVQAVGRACRLGDGKEKAHVMLPIFIEPGDTIEEAKTKSAFRDAFDTLNALREHNQCLADAVRKIRNEPPKNPETTPGAEFLDHGKIRLEVEGIVNGGVAGLKIEDFKKAFRVELLTEVRQTVEEKIDTILELATKGEGREGEGSRRKSELASELQHTIATYARENGERYRPEFAERLKKLMPEWVPDTAKSWTDKVKTKKTEILALAATPGVRQRDLSKKLRTSLHNYTSDSGTAYDPGFKEQLHAVANKGFFLNDKTATRLLILESFYSQHRRSAKPSGETAARSAELWFNKNDKEALKSLRLRYGVKDQETQSAEKWKQLEFFYSTQKRLPRRSWDPGADPSSEEHELAVFELGKFTSKKYKNKILALRRKYGVIGRLEKIKEKAAMVESFIVRFGRPPRTDPRGGQLQDGEKELGSLWKIRGANQNKWGPWRNTLIDKYGLDCKRWVP